MNQMTKVEPASDLRRIPLSAIKADPAVQQRVAGTSQEVIAQYAEAMREGAKFPPPTVFSTDGAVYHLADGFHRIAGFQLAYPEVQEIECEVRPGDYEDALLFACGANGCHGLQRTHADKRKAVKLLLSNEKWAHWSDREIARQSRVSHTLVAKVRHEHLEPLPDTRQSAELHVARKTAAPNASTNRRPSIDRSVMRGGKPYSMNIGGIGARRTTPGQRQSAGPGLELNSLVFSNWALEQQARFINAVGVAAIERVLRAIKPTQEPIPGFGELNRAYQAASEPARKKVVEINRGEIREILKLLPAIVGDGTPSPDETDP